MSPRTNGGLPRQQTWLVLPTTLEFCGFVDCSSAAIPPALYPVAPSPRKLRGRKQALAREVAWLLKLAAMNVLFPVDRDQFFEWRPALTPLEETINPQRSPQRCLSHGPDRSALHVRGDCSKTQYSFQTMIRRFHSDTHQTRKSSPLERNVGGSGAESVQVFKVLFFIWFRVRQQ